MILVDLTQTMIAGVMVQVKMNRLKGDEISEDLLRHMVLNTIRSYAKKFKNEYGDIVLCADDRKYWRREYFPNYKANRKKHREESDIDWDVIFGMLNKIRDEIENNLPYRFLRVEGAEADDIIGVLTKDSKEKVLIVSGDKDFQQLQKYDYVKQYSPNLSKFVSPDNAEEFLAEHILRGDKGDGIPNILSGDDVIVDGDRQKPMRRSTLNKYINGVDKYDNYYRNYVRNKTLIDLDEIPEEVNLRILKAFDESEPPSGKLLPYMMKHSLKELLNAIGDF
jgi:hypothetical protein